ncbi:MAG: acyl-CoA thioesterase [Ramlibacter sp.]|nr:acyl-CoA thioesterase [Ramlibacter sp.]
MTEAISSPAATPRTVVHTVTVEFGDCDPARIVWFPNFFRWIDAASRHFFVGCGVPPWHETEATLGVIGTPLVDTHARFVQTASYGDVLQIHVHIAEWRSKSFVQRYRIERARADGPADLIMECDEVRIFAARREGEATAIRAVPIPQALREMCQ